MPRSTAHVATAAAARYAKQLAAHLSRHAPATWDGVDGTITMPFGRCEMSAEVDQLVLRAEAPDDEALARVEEVVGQHLERFARRSDLSVEWVRLT